jgi:hypothetical protein
MPDAFIIAGNVALATSAIAIFVAFGLGMSDSPSDSDAPFKIFMFGMIIALLIAASYFLPW